MEQNGSSSNYSKAQTYLTASKSFLQHRNFQDSIKYALKSIQNDPNNPSPSQILAIAKVLSFSSIAEDTNYYKVLDLPLYTQDQQLIKTNFTNITNLLNPSRNQYPFASEAFQVVLKAWSVLSKPTHKTRFDDGLKKGGKTGTNFWTVCPYCYYVYEFPKVYVDCLLRCQNDKCKRGFHALPIVGPPPPDDVAEKGEYYCYGFSVLGLEGGGGKSLWSPFVKKNDDVAVEEDEFDVDEFIEISDGDDDDVVAEGGENGIKDETLGVEKTFVKSNGTRKKRIKMMAKSLKKVLGKGNRVNMNEVVYCEGNNENDDFEFVNVEGKIKTNESNVEFFVGDDDNIYVGLEEDFDVGIGDIETFFK
uniref:J domain-containing protein n=1 Tax=Nicotiana tabacum TaxID=4097 RepID=A0A1S4A9V9_TOBAC|nr:PREDICTED: uncharacterized protein LOC107795299 [Nicotiana tabacum]